MARWMDEDGGYRAVIVVDSVGYDPNKKETVSYAAKEFIGPYNAPGQAKAAVTFERKTRDGFIDGWIERATWKRID